MSFLLAASAISVTPGVEPLAAQQAAFHLPPLDRVLPPRAEAVYQAMRPRVDAQIAMETVTFMAPLWRLAGNPAYDRSIDFIAERLAARAVPHRIDTYEHSGQGWEQLRGALSIEGDAGGPVLSREQDR